VKSTIEVDGYNNYDTIAEKMIFPCVDKKYCGVRSEKSFRRNRRSAEVSVSKRIGKKLKGDVRLAQLFFENKKKRRQHCCLRMYNVYPNILESKTGG
jgi:hypothetical protein